MGELQLQVQLVVARDNAAHEHVAAAAGVFGQRLHHDVGTAVRQARFALAQVKAIERDAGAPGVVQHAGHAALAADGGQRGQRHELHRHRARCFEPHEPGLRADARLQIVRLHGVIELVRDAPVLQLAIGQRLGRPVSVIGDQDLVAALEQCHADVGDGRQPAGHQDAVLAAFQRCDALFQHEGGGCAVQAVGVAVLVFPVTGAHGRDIGKKDRGSLECPRLRSREPFGRNVGMVDQVGDRFAHAAMVACPAPRMR